MTLRSHLAARRHIAAHALPRAVPTGTIAELIERYEANPGPKNLERLEQALLVTGPVSYRSATYGIADARSVESIEVFRDVKRAELVRVP